MGQLDTGRLCPEKQPPGAGRTRSISQKPNKSKSKLEILDVQKEMLMATAEILQNGTARDILHSINLPKKSEYDNMLPLSQRESESDLDA
jgi:hypothetical protein